MPGIRLRVGDIHRIADRLEGTHDALDAVLRELGYRPERINHEYLEQSPRFTVSRCRRCGRWLTPWVYYNEPCPECGWTFMGGDRVALKVVPPSPCDAQRRDGRGAGGEG